MTTLQLRHHLDKLKSNPNYLLTLMAQYSPDYVQYVLLQRPLALAGETFHYSSNSILIRPQSTYYSPAQIIRNMLIEKEPLEKIAKFIQNCDQFNIPLMFPYQEMDLMKLTDELKTAWPEYSLSPTSIWNDDFNPDSEENELRSYCERIQGCKKLYLEKLHRDFAKWKPWFDQLQAIEARLKKAPDQNSLEVNAIVDELLNHSKIEGTYHAFTQYQVNRIIYRQLETVVPCFSSMSPEQTANVADYMSHLYRDDSSSIDFIQKMIKVLFHLEKTLASKPILFALLTCFARIHDLAWSTRDDNLPFRLAAYHQLYNYYSEKHPNSLFPFAGREVLRTLLLEQSLNKTEPLSAKDLPLVGKTPAFSEFIFRLEDVTNKDPNWREAFGLTGKVLDATSHNPASFLATFFILSLGGVAPLLLADATIVPLFVKSYDVFAFSQLRNSAEKLSEQEWRDSLQFYTESQMIAYLTTLFVDLALKKNKNFINALKGLKFSDTPEDTLLAQIISHTVAFWNSDVLTDKKSEAAVALCFNMLDALLVQPEITPDKKLESLLVKYAPSAQLECVRGPLDILFYNLYLALKEYADKSNITLNSIVHRWNLETTFASIDTADIASSPLQTEETPLPEDGQTDADDDELMLTVPGKGDVELGTLNNPLIQLHETIQNKLTELRNKKTQLEQLAGWRVIFLNCFNTTGVTASQIQEGIQLMGLQNSAAEWVRSNTPKKAQRVAFEKYISQCSACSPKDITAYAAWYEAKEKDHTEEDFVFLIRADKSKGQSEDKQLSLNEVISALSEKARGTTANALK